MNDYALPKQKKYPIGDLHHAKLALNPFFLRHASASEQKQIKKNVYSKYPELKRGNTNKAFAEGYSNDVATHDLKERA